MSRVDGAAAALQRLGGSQGPGSCVLNAVLQHDHIGCSISCGQLERGRLVEGPRIDSMQTLQYGDVALRCSCSPLSTPSSTALQVKGCGGSHLHNPYPPARMACRYEIMAESSDDEDEDALFTSTSVSRLTSMHCRRYLSMYLPQSCPPPELSLAMVDAVQV